jgi:hypothetical protein
MTEKQFSNATQAAIITSDPAACPMDGFHDSICTLSICRLRAFYARVWSIIRHGEVVFYRMWKEVRADLRAKHGQRGPRSIRDQSPECSPITDQYMHTGLGA